MELISPILRKQHSSVPAAGRAVEVCRYLPARFPEISSRLMSRGSSRNMGTVIARHLSAGERLCDCPSIRGLHGTIWSEDRKCSQHCQRTHMRIGSLDATPQTCALPRKDDPRVKYAPRSKTARDSRLLPATEPALLTRGMVTPRRAITAECVHRRPQSTLLAARHEQQGQGMQVFTWFDGKDNKASKDVVMS